MCVGHYFQKPGLQPVLHFLVVVRDEVGVPGFRVDIQVVTVGVFDELAAFADEVDYLVKMRFRHQCAPLRIAGNCIISASSGQE